MMAGIEIITVNPTSKCLSRSFFASLTVLVACLMIFSAVVQGRYKGYNRKRGAPWISLKSAQKRRNMNLD
jgi:hypothetical protein